ncbi:MAG TPA: alpha-glucosidase [Propionibacterium sp.]|nr:alpha-glucosidase [Propionibacterium sp.]
MQGRKKRHRRARPENPTLDDAARVRDFYAHPVGRDVIDKMFHLQGRSNRWVDNPIVGGMRLRTLDRLVRLFTGHELVPLVVDLANSEPHAPDPGEGQPEPTWWKEAVFYQVYPRSFADSDGDGVGDVGGILEHLDHLADLGVDCVWLSPIYDSPNEDGGYDVRDYRAVMAEMGTLDQVDALIAACHARGMRIILDLVVNHTSHEHEWFQRALADPDGPHGAYYFLLPADPEHPDQPPNNWESAFTGPAWRWIPEIERWVLHVFAPGQPDLNWENPRVRDEVVEVCRWWFDRGIDGFRMDVINFISKPPDLPDGHELIGDLLQVAGVEHYFYGPRLHEYLRELRERAFERPGSPPRVMVGETPGIGVETGRLLTGADRGELDLVFSFDHLESGSHSRFEDYRYDLEWYKRYLIDYQSRLGSNDWMTLFFENHDNPRMISKVNPEPEHRVALGKLLGTLQLTMRGTPFIHQGQELAAVNQPFTGIGDLQDVEAHRRFRALVDEGASEEDAWAQVLTSTRDHGRVPLRWDASPGGGFTTGTPWLVVHPDPGFSVAEQAADPDSVLQHYRRLIALRRRHRALRMGDVTFVDPERVGFFGWFRTWGTQRIRVELNLTDEPLTLPDHDPDADAGLLLGSHTVVRSGTLAPYESRVYRWPAVQQGLGAPEPQR